MRGWWRGRYFRLPALIGNARKLANLGTTPIGYILFRRHGAVMTNRWIDLTAQGWRRTTFTTGKAGIF